MAAAKLVDVTLVKAWNPGEPETEAVQRIVFAMALDHAGYPDTAAWLDDLAAWPARREGLDGAAQDGDVAHDDDGWSLRFFDGPAASADEPLHRIRAGSNWLRPGEVITLRDPAGDEAAWRVVGIG